MASKSRNSMTRQSGDFKFAWRTTAMTAQSIHRAQGASVGRTVMCAIVDEIKYL